MERLVALTDDKIIRLDDLPDAFMRPSSDVGDVILNFPPQGISLDELEEHVIREALIRNSWNQSQTAKFLRITRNTLIYRMQKHGLSTKEPGREPSNALKEQP
jgi:transcriptional regulator of acetoin/glycerol metabolism